MNSQINIPQAVLRSVLRRISEVLRRPVDQRELAASAIVFAPHPDDETLGCGGTIIQKKKAGADVKVVFMTDGSASHRRFLAEGELKAMRSREAVEACRILGIESDNVYLLGFRDGQLKSFRREAIEKVSALLRQQAVAQVFIPYAGDTTPDHKATHAFVMEALQTLDKSVIVYEYPVWFWMHWPWSSLAVSKPREVVSQLFLSSAHWLRMLRELRWAVPVGDVLGQKREALNQHRTQTVRLLPDPAWPVLSDVSNGEFIECLFQGQEVFYRHTV